MIDVSNNRKVANSRNRNVGHVECKGVGGMYGSPGLLLVCIECSLRLGTLGYGAKSGLTSVFAPTLIHPTVP